MTGSAFKVVVTFEAREGGGIRAYSDEVPGLILSGEDVDGVIADVPVVLSACLSHTFDRKVSVEPLAGLRDALAHVSTQVSPAPGPKEFLALVQ